MTKNSETYDKTSLLKLAEQYLVRSILDREIYTFLHQHPKTKSQKISKILSQGAGKSRNTIYKNINEFTNYSASSLLRYWSSMIAICKEYNVPEKDMPSLDSLLIKYKYLLDFINQIAIEDELDILINGHTEAVWEIYEIYTKRLNNSHKNITAKEKLLLEHLAEHPLIQVKINATIESKLERLRKK